MVSPAGLFYMLGLAYISGNSFGNLRVWRKAGCRKFRWKFGVWERNPGAKFDRRIIRGPHRIATSCGITSSADGSVARRLFLARTLTMGDFEQQMADLKSAKDAGFIDVMEFWCLHVWCLLSRGPWPTEK